MQEKIERTQDIEKDLEDFDRIGFKRKRLRILSAPILRQSQIKTRVGQR